VGHTSRSGGLLHLEASHARVSQSSLKTGRGATMGGACGIIMEVVSSGCIGLFYPNFAIFFVLGHKCSLIISFPINRTPRTDGEASNSAIPLPTP
jgi:hypothetical protein